MPCIRTTHGRQGEERSPKSPTIYDTLAGRYLAVPSFAHSIQQPSTVIHLSPVRDSRSRFGYGLARSIYSNLAFTQSSHSGPPVKIEYGHSECVTTWFNSTAHEWIDWQSHIFVFGVALTKHRSYAGAY